MSSLKELLAQQDALLKQIEELRTTERAGAIQDALALINDFKLTQSDLFPDLATGKKTRKPRAKSEIIYRDPVTGKTWSGNGRTPAWILNSGKNKSEFLITQ